jgi:hypothetical protein
MSGATEPLSEPELERLAGALRQRFQRLKLRLRELAEEEGLIPPGSSKPPASPEPVSPEPG